MPRLLAAPLRMHGLPATSSAVADSSADADSEDAAHQGLAGTGNRTDLLTPASLSQQQRGWLQRLGTAIVGGVLPSISQQDDIWLQSEPDKCPDQHPDGDADAHDGGREASAGQQADDAAVISTVAAAWRRGVQLALSAVRQLQASLLGYRPFPAMAHFGSQTLLHSVPGLIHGDEVTPVVTPQQPTQR